MYSENAPSLNQKRILATVCTHSHALILLVYYNKIVTTAHEQCAITRGACWKHKFCQFEQGVPML